MTVAGHMARRKQHIAVQPLENTRSVWRLRASRYAVSHAEDLVRITMLCWFLCLERDILTLKHIPLE